MPSSVDPSASPILQSFPLSKFNGYLLLLLACLVFSLLLFESSTMYPSSPTIHLLTNRDHEVLSALALIEDSESEESRSLTFKTLSSMNLSFPVDLVVNVHNDTRTKKEASTKDDSASMTSLTVDWEEHPGDNYSGDTKEIKTHKENYTFWSSDFHISPIADIKDILIPMGHKIIDKSLSGHCHLKHTCQKDLKVLNKQNGISLGKCPNTLRKQFFNAYKNDPQMQNVDAFLCNHAAGMCEVFMPFNKPMIIIASTRYEIGREDSKRWKEWNRNLKAIHANSRNIIAANNVYDAEYIKYFTGIQDVMVLPSFCGYTNVHYQPSKKEILIGPGRGVKPKILKQLKDASSKNRQNLAPIRDLYPHFEYSDLVKHRAIVLIPYQVSIMSIFEYYRMEIPIFVPSPKLLAEWQLQYRLMNERTWSGVYGRFQSKSNIEKDSAIVDNPHLYFKDLNKYDPNNENDRNAIEFWIQFSDFYVWPHIKTFNSIDELMTMLKNHSDEDLMHISREMRKYNEETKSDLVHKWNYIIHERMFPNNEAPASVEKKAQISTYEEALEKQYGIIAGTGCHGDQHPSGVPKAME